MDDCQAETLNPTLSEVHQRVCSDQVEGTDNRSWRDSKNIACVRRLSEATGTRTRRRWFALHAR